MIYAIVRLYATPDVAAKAYALLEERGLSREDHFINLVTPATATTAEALAAAISNGGRVLFTDAKIYAQGVLHGHSLVSVHAPFGAGRMYEELLDELNPVDSGILEEHDEVYWEDAAPFSSAFGFPVLSKPHPYLFMGLPAIDRSGATTSSFLGLGELASPHLAVFGTPRISRNPGPFSGLFRLPLLK
jgi:hypothetical protein